MLRSLLAVALGYVVMLVAFISAETALTALAPELMPQMGKPIDPLYFLFKLATGFVFISIGGYATAMLAGRSEMKHALGLGALSITMSIVSRLMYPGEPLWYSIALMFLAIPAALVGGYFRARQVEDGKAHAAAAD